MASVEPLSEIRREAARADALQRQARELLIDAVHRAADEGLSQREIAQTVRRSQPEVSRLLRQKRPGPLALKVSQSRQQLIDVLTKFDVTDARIFGSVATRAETSGSDVDVLIDTNQVLGLGALSRLEQELSAVIDADVDVVPLSALPTYARDRALAESVPL